MSMGGETRPGEKTASAHRNWARVVASWFVVFFIVASWSILFRTVSPLLFGSRHARMPPDMSGDLCIIPVGPGLARALDEGRTCEVVYTAP